MKEFLLNISKNTREKFAVIKDGKAYHLSDGVEIPVDHMMYQRMLKDGYYTISAATCGEDSGCKVGNYLKTCNAYSKKKCAVYALTDISEEKLFISIDTLRNICENYTHEL